MIKISKHGEVTRFDLARSIAGHGRYWTTAYAVDGMLVDTGCAHTAPEFIQALDGIVLNTIVNSHSHEDHIGANGPLQRVRGDVDILAHPHALQILADPRKEQPLHPYRRYFWGWPDPSRGQQVSNGEFIETDHHRFQVIYTPGHSPDHLCLFEPDHGWLFTGDLYVGGRDRALRAEYEIWQIIESLKRVVELPLKWLFPGSARVREDPKGELISKIGYLEEMGENVLELHRQGHGVSSIIRTLLGPIGWVEVFTLGHFSRRHLVLSYLRNRLE